MATFDLVMGTSETGQPKYSVAPYHGNDEFAFVVGLQREFFKRPSTHSLAVEDASRLRKFLKDAGVLGQSTKAYTAKSLTVRCRSSRRLSGIILKVSSYHHSVERSDEFFTPDSGLAE